MWSKLGPCCELSPLVFRASSQVESLQAVIKDKTEDYDSLIAANQQAQNDLIERNDEIDKLAGRIRELEQALLNSADSSRSVSQLEQEVHRTKLRERELLQVTGPTGDKTFSRGFPCSHCFR